MDQTLTLDEAERLSITKILQDVFEHQSIVTILLPDGREAIIGPKPRLKPLPELEGQIPVGWKDALYVRD
jgi:hypothetical protein